MKKPLRYLALGDSYTIGEGLAPEQRWPVQLCTQLAQHGIAITSPKIIARTGWTTDELMAGIDDALARDQTAKLPFDLISLQIGVNNQYRGRHVDEFAEQFETLIERAIAMAAGKPSRLFVVSIPDWGITPFAIAQGRDRPAIAGQLDQFNHAAESICRKRRIEFIDISTDYRQHGSEADMLVDDALHPSAAMYSRWVAKIEPTVMVLLNADRQ